MCSSRDRINEMCSCIETTADTKHSMSWVTAQCLGLVWQCQQWTLVVTRTCNFSCRTCTHIFKYSLTSTHFYWHFYALALKDTSLIPDAQLPQVTPYYCWCKHDSLDWRCHSHRTLMWHQGEIEHDEWCVYAAVLVRYRKCMHAGAKSCQ